MDQSRFEPLAESPFPRLNRLIEGLEPGAPPILLSLGEPQHPIPAFVSKTLRAHEHEYGRYPPSKGTPAFRQAAANWLTRRFALPAGAVDPETQILPVNGTREALFSIALIATPLSTSSPNGTAKPAIAMPNPFYQCYAAAALAAGADPVYVPATRDTGFLPDFAGLPETILARTSLIYFCSPANPQGAVASLDYLKELIALARAHDIVLVVDECYADIYDREPSPGALQAATALGNGFDNVIVFHSLSKRSSLPGLRSGFCAGDTRLMKRFDQFRTIAAPQTPLPALAVATACWNDDAHAAENRALYQRKIDIAERVLGNRFGFYRPPGGFFLWLDVGDGEVAARALWQKAGVKVLPGKYLARDDPAVPGGNPGRAYIRVALVQDETVTEHALTRLADTL